MASLRPTNKSHSSFVNPHSKAHPCPSISSSFVFCFYLLVFLFFFKFERMGKLKGTGIGHFAIFGTIWMDPDRTAILIFQFLKFVSQDFLKIGMESSKWPKGSREALMISFSSSGSCPFPTRSNKKGGEGCPNLLEKFQQERQTLNW